ncbi:tRNA (adenosine(37)-N6)-threonylcarbamoyltransferase complex ATPase subunit type 1 TsaE [Noviherbaspirillum galbum]|uniref:tRNA threonylcarbamoyladenosine biosynthesis protein TsaE n=1 Tax=Noviherbaspirillum galbum TaxID=2709383 RepID=A0A6B3SR06_9BURK|nr:tRNA (adenosine(37)-N6)-threonylcarbamoyltransferase complex ATPase subunit type 1 TsaE [Noviherbaspirillum galbum]NEX60842.1 tRNA (adenosine(37)-N6)-threonylcarbamoyltransferase complex ATPase subunit type 1 TsaE [Noviherbaspirillum galbum]
MQPNQTHLQAPHLQFHLPAEADTVAFGAAFARALAPGLHIQLRGNLGAGKTALTRAMLQAAGHRGPVRSPTYTLAEPYSVVIGNQRVDVVHFDLYRLASPEEFLDAGFREYFGNDTICIVEWPEKAGPVLPSPDIMILLSIAGQGREIELQALSDQGMQCLNRLTAALTPPTP